MTGPRVEVGEPAQARLGHGVGGHDGGCVVADPGHHEEGVADAVEGCASAGRRACRAGQERGDRVVDPHGQAQVAGEQVGRRGEDAEFDAGTRQDARHFTDGPVAARGHDQVGALLDRRAGLPHSRVDDRGAQDAQGGSPSERRRARAPARALRPAGRG